ncbi:hypothetical protein [Halorubrum sp. DTA46]|uniref:hypothetical protein n=1 Tax=Halorubrum sp. DTA46 TaxID=3402162 RepID=UPI003AAD8628
MSAKSPAVGIDHHTVVPANVDRESDDIESDDIESDDTESDDIETTATGTVGESDESTDG